MSKMLSDKDEARQLAEIRLEHRDCLSGYCEQSFLLALVDKLRLAYSHLKSHHVQHECGDCAEADCPFGETLHYHHDECPAEWAENQKLRASLAKCRKHLENAEFSNGDECPVCGALIEDDGHGPGCGLALALAATGDETP